MTLGPGTTDQRPVWAAQSATAAPFSVSRKCSHRGQGPHSLSQPSKEVSRLTPAPNGQQITGPKEWERLWGSRGPLPEGSGVVWGTWSSSALEALFMFWLD